MASSDKASADVMELTVDINALPFVPGRNPFDIHVYFSGAAESTAAAALRTDLLLAFKWLRPQGWWPEPIGPHPQPMFEVDFAAYENKDHVNDVIRWLEANRNGLAILVHPHTTHGPLKDHTTHAVWLGNQLPLLLHKL